jgi:hypothetical protein
MEIAPENDSNMRKQYTTVRGYDMRIRRTDASHTSDYQINHAWAPKGQLPTEWEDAKNNPENAFGQIYYGTERRKRADKRSILDTFSR